MIEIRIGNIEEQTDVDAIVNAANPQLRPGSGVCGAIYRAAGLLRLNAEVMAAFPPSVYPEGILVGDTAVTSAGDLPVKFLIHAVGPIYVNYTPEQAAHLLRSAYQSVFEDCKERGLTRVAVPAISTGIYGYPLEEAAIIAVETARHAEMFYPELHIIFVIWQVAYEAFKAALDGTSGGGRV